jgi:hypothetical protein
MIDQVSPIFFAEPTLIRSTDFSQSPNRRRRQPVGTSRQLARAAYVRINSLKRRARSCLSGILQLLTRVSPVCRIRIGCCSIIAGIICAAEKHNRPHPDYPQVEICFHDLRYAPVRGFGKRDGQRTESHENNATVSDRPYKRRRAGDRRSPFELRHSDFACRAVALAKAGPSEFAP